VILGLPLQGGEKVSIALIRPSVEAKIGENKVLSAKVISDMAYIGESEEAVA